MSFQKYRVCPRQVHPIYIGFDPIYTYDNFEKHVRRLNLLIWIGQYQAARAKRG